MIDDRRTVLVAFASRHGSTRQVAETVALHLRERGWHVQVRSASSVSRVDRFAAVVLGAALYMGRVHPDARTFLKRHHADLAAMPLAVYAMGPRTAGADDLAASRRQLDACLEHYPQIVPSVVEVFGGVVDPASLHFPFNHMAASDARDWSAIAVYAAHAADAFVDSLAVQA
jgi:menaquinone-dependent protoporphyrinogen oxidase